MLVMILEKAPASLRGELSRWLIEPHTGVFVGNLSARVRDQLWTRACQKAWDGSVVQLWTDSTSPQGYRYRTFGVPARVLLDHEGIALVRMPPKEKRRKKTGEDAAPRPAPPAQPPNGFPLPDGPLAQGQW